MNKVYNVWAKKTTGELCLTALNTDTTFEGKLTCAFKNDMRNSSKFSPEYIWKSKNWKFDGILLSKVEICELKIYKGVLCHDNEEWYLIWTGIDLAVQNWQDEYFDTSTQKSQKFALEQVAFDQSI